MNTLLQSPVLLHPERIHPALWRGSQLAGTRRAAIPTGFDLLNHELPNQGWPVGTLIELMPCRPGIGELHLLRPALAQLDSDRCIALLSPPYIPHFHCWFNWQLGKHRLLWIKAETVFDSLWSAEQILKNQACAALLCWSTFIRPQALRRLQWLATQTDILFILFRPPAAAQQPSAAPLRVALEPATQGVAASILKRRGPTCASPILIPLYPARTEAARPMPHATLDLSLPAHAQSGRDLSALAN
ncbi:MAG: translesion DNA synthesis-associated protein ImuA [Paralcaligenes sp.]